MGIHFYYRTDPLAVVLVFDEEGWEQRLSELMRSQRRPHACLIVEPTPKMWRTISDELLNIPFERMYLIDIPNDQTLESICSVLSSSDIKASHVALNALVDVNPQPLCDLVTSKTTNIRILHGNCLKSRRIYQAASRFTKLDVLHVSYSLLEDAEAKKIAQSISEAATARKSFMPLLAQASGDLQRLPNCLLHLLWKFLA